MIFHPSTLASFLPSLSITFVHAFIYSCINHHELTHPDLPAFMYIVTSCPFHSIYQPINPYIHLSAQLGSRTWLVPYPQRKRNSRRKLRGTTRLCKRLQQECGLGLPPIELLYTSQLLLRNILSIWEISEKLQGDWGLTGFSRPETKNRHWTSSLRSQTIANSCLYSSPVSCFWRHRPPGHASWRPVYRRRVLPKTTGVQREDRMPSFGMIWALLRDGMFWF